VVVVSFFVTNTAWAAPAHSAQVPGVATKIAANHLQLDLSETLASVDEIYQGSSDSNPIYLIQDAHTSLEAQENIAKTINHLVREKQIKTVYVEGYEGKVPLDALFSQVKEPEAREKVSYFLMDYLRLNGARFAYINRKQDFNLVGIESLQDYFF